MAADAAAALALTASWLLAVGGTPAGHDAAAVDVFQVPCPAAAALAPATVDWVEGMYHASCKGEIRG